MKTIIKASKVNICDTSIVGKIMPMGISFSSDYNSWDEYHCEMVLIRAGDSDYLVSITDMLSALKGFDSLRKEFAEYEMMRQSAMRQNITRTVCTEINK